MKFTSVVGYHMNPMTCGVAKFNAELAKRLGVPFVGIGDKWGARPLFSLKWSEFDQEDGGSLLRARLAASPCDYGVFWHDRGNDWLNKCAAIVYHADPSLGPNGLWCPSLLTPSKPRTVRLFSFGMAHKLQTAHYAKVRQLLDAAGLDYRLRVSVGLHEGTSLDDATKHFDALREIMGADKVSILGILSDDAVSEELAAADYVLAFFEKGVRANNTTVHAAMDHGCRIVTNEDRDSPSFVYADLWCVCCLNAWPRTGRTGYSWDNLIMEMEKVCEASKSATV